MSQEQQQQPEELVFKGYAIKDTKKYTDFEVIEFKPKTFGEYDIDIKINVCGVCSSDVHTLTAGWSEPSVMPLIAGHEVAGTVVKVGSKVTEFKVGDRAGVGAQVCSCFKCKPCETNNENYCVTGGVDTYNSKYENGDIAHGGYATGIRVHERFVFKLPNELKDEDVASMLCGGLTVFAPLRAHTKPGQKVAIAGIGGLGHYAIQFANALGLEVTALSHQADKKDDCLKMGAKHFVLTTEKDFAKDHAFEFDMILSTVDDSAGIPLTDFLSMLTLGGRFHSCGLPDKPLPEIKAQSLASNAASISVSHIGSKEDVKAMLKLAVEHNITTWKEILSMKDVGRAIEGVKNNKVRYRYVLKMDL